mmetsp:Transcript_44353/g.77916  ORF Transcript_44353/g.77916 Transcript_44353/m.77916 type:complete len:249 (-) Transcript_44353:1446-2192(-)
MLRGTMVAAGSELALASSAKMGGACLLTHWKPEARTTIRRSAVGASAATTLSRREPRPLSGSLLLTEGRCTAPRFGESPALATGEFERGVSNPISLMGAIGDFIDDAAGAIREPASVLSARRSNLSCMGRSSPIGPGRGVELKWPRRTSVIRGCGGPAGSDAARLLAERMEPGCGKALSTPGDPVFGSGSPRMCNFQLCARSSSSLAVLFCRSASFWIAPFEMLSKEEKTSICAVSVEYVGACFTPSK